MSESSTLIIIMIMSVADDDDDAVPGCGVPVLLWHKRHDLVLKSAMQTVLKSAVHTLQT